MNFFGMGPLEIILILILGFLFFGPEKLPGMAAKAGKFMRNFSKATGELQRTLTTEISLENELQEKQTKGTGDGILKKPENSANPGTEQN